MLIKLLLNCQLMVGVAKLLIKADCTGRCTSMLYLRAYTFLLPLAMPIIRSLHITIFGIWKYYTIVDNSSATDTLLKIAAHEDLTLNSMS